MADQGGIPRFAPAAGPAGTFPSRLVFLALLWLAFLLALHWNSFTMPFERDEGEYAYSSWIMRLGQAPYEHAFMQKPPMIIYTYLAAQLLGGDGTWPPRAMAFLFLLLGTVVLAGLVRRRYGSAPAFALLWLFPLMTMAAFLSPFAANTERFMLLPLCALLAVLDRSERSLGLRPWLWGGVLGAVTILYKPIALAVVGWVWLYWLIKGWRGTGEVPWRRLLALGTGAAATVFLASLYFIGKGALGALWECAVLFNVYYIRALPQDFSALLRHLELFLAGWWILVPFLGYFLFKRPADWLLYLPALVIGALSIRQTLNAHYYIMLVPFLAVMTALGVSGLAADTLGRLGALRGPRGAEIAMGTVLVVVLATLVLPAPAQYVLSPEALSLEAYQSPFSNPFVEAELVAQKLASITGPQDPVFIIGAEPEILYYARRRSATRFVIMSPFCIQSPFYSRYASEMSADLAKTPPEAIVVVQSLGTLGNNAQGLEWLGVFFMAKLKNYEQVGGYVRAGGIARWEEPLAAEHAPSTTLMLFHRKR